MLAIIVFVFILLIVLIVIGGRKQKENEARVSRALDLLGIAPVSILFKTKYLSGHPDIDEAKDQISVVQSNGSIDLYFIPYGLISGDPVKHGSIPAGAITRIAVEDKTTVEGRVTIGRLLLAGVFALAWKKKKVDEAAYLVIEWSDRRFSHETVLEFTGKTAMQKANAARNALIKVLQ